MRFDAYAALAKLRSEGGSGAKRAKRANQSAQFSTISTISTGQAVQPATADEPRGKVIEWIGKRYPPEAVRQDVAAAFDDYAATDDPQDPRAWA